MDTWKVNGSEDTTAIWVEDESGQRVATVRNCDNDLDRANLIAASPELLDALIELKAQVIAIGVNGCSQQVSAASAAISKATGSQS